jgi:hypothetical protein
VGGLRRGILESAGGQALGNRDSKDAERDRQQRGDDDDPSRRSNGQPGDSVQQLGPPLGAVARSPKLFTWK